MMTSFEDKQLLFLVGFPRSGTTLLQTMIATHAEVITLPETHFFSRVTNHISTDELITNEAMTQISASVAKWMNFVWSPEVPSRGWSKKEAFLNLLEDYLQQNSPDYKGRIILEKTPAHLGCVDELRELFPKAYFVGIVRNPYAAISSYLSKFNHVRTPTARLARRWHREYSRFNDQTVRLPDNTLLVRYEDLTADPYNSISRVNKLIGLTDSEAKLDHLESQLAAVALPHETWKNNNSRPIQNNNEATIAKLSKQSKWIVSSVFSGNEKVFGYEVKSNNLVEQLLVWPAKFWFFLRFAIHVIKKKFV